MNGIPGDLRRAFESKKIWMYSDYQPDVCSAFVLVDGQFGSTGKGVIAAAMAEAFHEDVDVVISNAGPNSGHTSYHEGEKIVLKQLPTFSVITAKINGEGFTQCSTYLSAGAVINPGILNEEAQRYDVNVDLDRWAAVISMDDISNDQFTLNEIAGTGQGVGPAIIGKISRITPKAVVATAPRSMWCDHITLRRHIINSNVFMEVSQGFSLGINQGFYPYCTSRECTVSQALSDAGLPPTSYTGGILSVRTYPIRVGDTANTSGGCYPDQREVTWEEVGVEPEYTTVTQRKRRVFTWSDYQFRMAVKANAPSVVFLNFCNYLDKVQLEDRVASIYKTYFDVMGRNLPLLVLGHGPTTADLEVLS